MSTIAQDISVNVSSAFKIPEEFNAYSEASEGSPQQYKKLSDLILRAGSFVAGAYAISKAVTVLKSAFVCAQATTASAMIVPLVSGVAAAVLCRDLAVFATNLAKTVDRRESKTQALKSPLATVRDCVRGGFKVAVSSERPQDAFASLLWRDIEKASSDLYIVKAAQKLQQFFET